MCAAFSVLSLTLEIAGEKLTEDDIRISLENGEMAAQWKQVSPEGLLLIKAYIEGVKALAKNYPEYINVQARDTLKTEE